jgi:hypothetical protein
MYLEEKWTQLPLIEALLRFHCDSLFMAIPFRCMGTMQQRAILVIFWRRFLPPY